MLSPALFASALLVFLFDFTSFGVILLLGGGYMVMSRKKEDGAEA